MGVLRGCMGVCSLLFLHFIAMTAAAAAPAPPKKEPSAANLQSAADTALAKGDFKTAIKFYSKLIKKQPSQINYHKRGAVYSRKKDYTKAIVDYTKAVELDAKFIKGYSSRAKAYLLTGDCQSAVDDYTAVLQKKATNKDALKQLPQAQECLKFRQMGIDQLERDPNSAKAYLSEALKIAYESTSLLLLRAQAHMVQQDYQSVLVDTRQVLKADKSNLEALLVRGNAYYRIGDHDVALQHYREGLRSDPEAKALKTAAKMLKALIKATTQGETGVNEGRYEEAVEAFQRALTLDLSNQPFQVKLYVKLCQALSKHKQHEKALEACSQAIRRDAQNIDAYMQRGAAHIEAEQYQEAINDYTRATEIDNNHQGARQGLQNAKLEQKKAARKNYYKILGVEKDADGGVIKKAFRKLALVHHPDRVKGEEAKEEAEKVFRDIGEAYEVLSDPEKRGKYDRGEDIEVPQQQRHPFRQGGQQFNFRWGN